MSRYLEYSLVYSFLDLRDGHHILDIGTGYSIFPLYLAAARKYVIHITDNERHLPDVIRFHHAKLKKLHLWDDVQNGRIIVERQDACQLAYPAASFDRISCISVIEHIGGTGDCAAMREIGRVLRPGGVAVLTFPYARKYEERESSTWVEYFERSYDEKTINNRLIHPSGLRELARRYFGEPFLHVSRMYGRDIPRLLRLAFEVTTPLWARAFMRVWQEPVDAAYGTLLVLAKPEGTK